MGTQHPKRVKGYHLVEGLGFDVVSLQSIVPWVIRLIVRVIRDSR